MGRSVLELAQLAWIGHYMDPPYGLSSNVYLAPPGGASTGVSVSANTIYAARVFVAKPRTFTVLGCNVQAAGFGASSTARMAICNHSHTTDAPSDIVLDAGTIAVDATGLKTYTISQYLGTGLYWLLWQTGGSGGQLTFSTAGHQPLGKAIVSTSNHGSLQYLSRASTYGAYSSQAGASWTLVHNFPSPLFFMR
jgi:hypothetical protein